MKTTKQVEQASHEAETAYSEFHKCIAAEKARTARLEDIEGELPGLRQAVQDAQEEKGRVLTGFAGGTATEADVRAARKALSETEDRLAEREEMYSALRAARHDNDHYFARQAAADARERLADVACEFYLDKIRKHRAWPEIRRALVAGYFAAGMCRDVNVGALGRTDWSLVIENLLPEPSPDELDKIENEVREIFSGIPEAARG